MTPIRQTLEIVQEKINNLKKDPQSDEFIVHFIELKEYLKQKVDSERQNIIYAFESGKYSNKHSDGEEYYNNTFIK